jgi:hypothetical protein
MQSITDYDMWLQRLHQIWDLSFGLTHPMIGDAALLVLQPSIRLYNAALERRNWLLVNRLHERSRKTYHEEGYRTGDAMKVTSDRRRDGQLGGFR